MTLPQSVLKLMWEYDAKGLQGLIGMPDAVLERVMIRGGWEEMVWLKEKVGVDRLGEFLVKRGARVLPPRELRYWCFVCGINDSIADGWVSEARRRVKEWRG